MLRFPLLLLLLAAAMPAAAQVLPSFGSDRAGTVGFQFLKIPTDPRSIALGEAVVTDADGAAALFWNPALAAANPGYHVGAARASHYAGALFTTNQIGGIAPLGAFAIGVGLQTLDSGEMDVTTEFEPMGTGERFRFIDVAAGITIAQQLTDLFSYGVTVKAVHESVAEVSTTTAALDLGIHYRIGSTGAEMGVAIRHFGLDGEPGGELSRTDPTAPEGVIVERDFETITLPTTFLLGLSYHAFRATPDHALTISSQLYRPNDNAESLSLGGEYTFREALVLRAGYRFGVEEYVASFGGGVRVEALGAAARVDYGFTRLERLGNVHAFGLNFSF